MAKTKREKKTDDLSKIIAKGENSTRQFKADIRNGEALAAEMAALANSEGGTIYIGVADDGSLPGLARKDVTRIDFTDDREACLFTATVHREAVAETGKTLGERSQKSSQKILKILKENPEVTIAELSVLLGITDRAVKKNLTTLKKSELIKRVGPDKGGHWEVIG